MDQAERMMKALCNHFARKITAHYEDNIGFIDFGNGTCELTAAPNELRLHVKADNAEGLEHVKKVVISHLMRFMSLEELPVTWVESE